MSNGGDPKKEVVELLRRHYDVRRIAGQSIFDISSKAQLYIRYSKDLGGGKFFFGVGEQEFSSRLGHNLFVLFVCGSAERTVVIPADVLRDLVKGVQVAHGQWKLNVFGEGATILLQVPGRGKFDVSQFNNYFDFTPRDYISGYTPQIGEHVPLAPRKEIVEPPTLDRAPDTLEDRLCATSRDSDNPAAFERTLQEFFSEIGLRARLIGTPGETDVLIEGPRRIVVDGKSTKFPSLSHVNFTRIKQHRLASNADAMLIVSVGFQPALVRDGVIEQAGLVTVETLLKLLAIHRTLPMSPLDHAEIFSRKGLISDTDLAGLEAQLKRCDEWLGNALLILDNIDLQPRSVDEIKGRIDIRTQEAGRPSLTVDEIAATLHVLASEPFRVISIIDNKFALRFYPKQARERMAAIMRLFHDV